MNLSEFLLARIAEDEEAARACAEVYPPPWELSDRGWVAYVRADEPNFREVSRLEDQGAAVGWLGDRLAHIARHDPARVLAECEAKREILDLQADWRRHPDSPAMLDVSISQDEIDGRRDMHKEALRALALPYADHPDYRDEWRP